MKSGLCLSFAALAGALLLREKKGCSGEETQQTNLVAKPKAARKAVESLPGGSAATSEPTQAASAQPKATTNAVESSVPSVSAVDSEKAALATQGETMQHGLNGVNVQDEKKSGAVGGDIPDGVSRMEMSRAVKAVETIYEILPGGGGGGSGKAEGAEQANLVAQPKAKPKVVEPSVPAVNPEKTLTLGELKWLWSSLDIIDETALQLHADQKEKLDELQQRDKNVKLPLEKVIEALRSLGYYSTNKKHEEDDDAIWTIMIGLRDLEAVRRLLLWVDQEDLLILPHISSELGKLWLDLEKWMQKNEKAAEQIKDGRGDLYRLPGPNRYLDRLPESG